MSSVSPWMAKTGKPANEGIALHRAVHLSADIVRVESDRDPLVSHLRSYFGDTTKTTRAGGSLFRWVAPSVQSAHKEIIEDTQTWERILAATFSSFHDRQLDMASWEDRKKAASKRYYKEELDQTLYATHRGNRFIDNLPEGLRQELFHFRKFKPHPIVDIANGKIASMLSNTVTITNNAVFRVEHEPEEFNRQYRLVKWFFAKNNL